MTINNVARNDSRQCCSKRQLSKAIETNFEFMICTTIQNKTAEQILEALEQCEMAEIRLDSCVLSARETEDVFTSDVPLVATCRIAEVMKNEPSLQDMPEAAREVKAMMLAEKRLVRAIEAGARYVDVEIEAPKQMSKRVRSAAHENGTIFIRSYHDLKAQGRSRV